MRLHGLQAQFCAMRVRTPGCAVLCGVVSDACGGVWHAFGDPSGECCGDAVWDTTSRHVYRVRSSAAATAKAQQAPWFLCPVGADAAKPIASCNCPPMCILQLSMCRCLAGLFCGVAVGLVSDQWVWGSCSAEVAQVTDFTPFSEHGIAQCGL